MQTITKRLKWSIVGLLTIPYIFIISCGIYSLNVSYVYEYTDIIMIMFLTLVLIFSLVSIYYYMLLSKLKKKELDTQVIGGLDSGDDEVSEFENVIGKDTQFVGDINTTNDVLILGSVNGNIKTTADVYVDGMVEGSITCRNLAMNEAIINADIDCYMEVCVDALSIVRGNVHTDVLIHNGKIKGNIDIEGYMELSKDCIILGDIFTREMQFPPGAQIHGNLNIK